VLQQDRFQRPRPSCSCFRPERNQRREVKDSAKTPSLSPSRLIRPRRLESSGMSAYIPRLVVVIQNLLVVASLQGGRTSSRSTNHGRRDPRRSSNGRSDEHRRTRRGRADSSSRGGSEEAEHCCLIER